MNGVETVLSGVLALTKSMLIVEGTHETPMPNNDLEFLTTVVRTEYSILAINPGIPTSLHS